MSCTPRSITRLRVTVTIALVALATVVLQPVKAAAQGGGGGGFGAPGGMGGRGHSGFGKQDNASAPEVGKHFEEMASLKPALKHVDGLSGDQKTSFDEIEHSYGKALKSLGHDAQQMVDSAHAAHERPDHQRMDSLRKQAKQLRDEELTAARDMLTTDPQRQQFDANVTQIHADEAKREEQMDQQMSPGNPPPGAH
jgi:hypothetical protein